MNIALFGADGQSISLVQSMTATGRNVVCFACDIPSAFITAVEELFPNGIEARPWELLLDTSQFDVVVVAPSDDVDRRARQLPKLVQVGVPMILLHPACESIVGYELEMIRKDAGGVLIPVSPGVYHPAMFRLEQLARAPSGELGRVQQLTFDRELADRTEESVLRQFAQDAMLIRLILGDATKRTGPG